MFYLIRSPRKIVFQEKSTSSKDWNQNQTILQKFILGRNFKPWGNLSCCFYENNNRKQKEDFP